MSQEVKNYINGQSKHGLSDSNVKTEKFLTWASQEQKMCTFLGLKVKSAICDGTSPTCTLNVVNMNAQVFRDPKSSNRIEISRFVKFLLTFDWYQGSIPPRGWGWVDGGGTLSECLGYAPSMYTCAHMHVCICAYMYKHDNFMQMAAPIWESWGIPLWHHHSHACAHALVHMCGTPSKYPDRVPPNPPTPTPHGGGPPKSVKSQ